MKIVQILYSGLGGHTAVAFSLIEGDQDRKYKHLLIGYGIEEPGETFKEKARETNTHYHSILKKRGFDMASQKSLWKVLKEEKPDVIIMHSTAVVFTVFLFRLFARVKWIAVEHQSNFAKSKKDWFYTFFILLFSPRIVYLTDAYKKQVRKKMGIFFSGNKVTVIPNGINIEKYYSAQEKELNSEITYIAMISRFTKLRDHGTLIKAVGEVKKRRPVRLLLAGDGETKADMQHLVNELDLTDVVEFLGDISENEIIALLKRVDIYVHSSLAETQSTSLLQVMASKTPVIATDIPGINNVFDEGVNALLFTPFDIFCLVTKIEELISNAGVKNKINLNAYRKVTSTFGIEVMFNEYKALWG